MTHMLEGNHPWDLDHVMKSKTIREFDSRFTAVQFGFKDVEDYYRTACLPGKLHEIRVPLVCLSAADDPFQPIHGIPYEEARKSSHVGIIITSRGGHIGFMEGILPTNRYFSDRLYAQLLQGIFNDYDSLLKAQRECDDFQVLDDQIRQ
ncbi:Phospholipase ABHD3 [Armadillidium vulgare]|nr:Phospholipase ABHD3 [Armadillidium vulgare]